MSIHFDGKMYVHGSFVHAPLWVGDSFVWITLPNCGTPGFGMRQDETQTWRRVMVLS